MEVVWIWVKCEGVSAGPGEECGDRWRRKCGTAARCKPASAMRLHKHECYRTAAAPHMAANKQTVLEHCATSGVDLSRDRTRGHVLL